MALIAGTVTSYAGILYDVLRVFGIAALQNAPLQIAGINLITLFFALVPQLCYVITNDKIYMMMNRKDVEVYFLDKVPLHFQHILLEQLLFL